VKHRKFEEIKDKVIPILMRHDVRRAAIFGSFVRGEEKENSDIDILIELEEKEKISLLDLASVKIELEEALGRSVDVVEYSAIHPLVKDRILKEQEVIM